MTMRYIETNIELERFKAKLANESRIILSAGYGQGKTTFLQMFRNKYDNEYLFINLYPVNYPVASNEDIFEYIKRDILVQLMTRNDLAEPITSAIKKTWKSIKSPKVLGALARTCINLLGQVPGMRFLNDIVDLGENVIKEFCDTYGSKSDSPQDVIDAMTQQKGGLYEEDDVTLLIRELLKQRKQGKGDLAKSVLIIDDLDRIDPGHMFRILNVLAANIDYISGDKMPTSICTGEQLLKLKENENKRNKFGFDNIVTVFDYYATKDLYYHLYGSKQNYEGYIGKFKVNQPFFFDIRMAVQKELDAYIESITPIQANVLREITLNWSLRDIVNALNSGDNNISMDALFASGYFNLTQAPPILRLMSLFKKMNCSHEEINKMFSGFVEEGNVHPALIDKQSRVKLFKDVYFVSPLMRKSCYEILNNGSVEEKYLQMMMRSYPQESLSPQTPNWTINFHKQQENIEREIIAFLINNCFKY